MIKLTDEQFAEMRDTALHEADELLEASAGHLAQAEPQGLNVDQLLAAAQAEALQAIAVTLVLFARSLDE